VRETTEIMFSQLHTETIDQRWRDEAHTQVNNIFGDHQFKESRLENIDCREKLCQVHVLHKSSSALKKFLMELPSVLSWNGREFIKTMDNGDGAFSKAVFIASEGHEFKLTTHLEFSRKI